jgi:diadenosine tetraphosphate (Ap4A) HIT family hydrolase
MLVADRITLTGIPSITVLANEHFSIEPCSTCHMPGYLIVTPRDTLESLSRMNVAPLVSLGPTWAMVKLQSKPSFSQSEFTALSVHFHLFPRTEWLTAKYFAAHPRETEFSGSWMMDRARRMFRNPISGMYINETFEKIRAWLRSANLR